MTIPQERKALVIQPGQTLRIEKLPVPPLTTDQDILIKVGTLRKLVLG